MGKRRIFTITFWVLTVLLFCTAVSFKIQDLMRNEVIVKNPESKDGMTQKIAATAVLAGENGTGVYVVTTEKGIRGEEQHAKFKTMTPVGQEGEQAVFMMEAELKKVITESVYPVEEDMIVEQVWEILTKEEAVKVARRQKENLKILAVAILVAFLLAFWAERCMIKIFDRKYGRCIAGLCLLFIAGMLLYVCMEKVEIPRPALPEACIFDWDFYKGTFF